MTTNRIKEKISQIVSSQFPEFIQSDHKKFIAFFESYYKFLEQDQHPQELIQNILDYNNIDFTTTAFIKYFLKNYAEILPDTLLADKKIAIKRIKDIYEAKGSTLSFQLFFRIVFNEDARVIFPYENVLIPSGGTFLQRRSLRISTSSGDRDKILDRFLTTTVSNQEFRTPILETSIINDTLTEVFLDINFLASAYAINQQVTVSDLTEGGNTLFTGNVEPTTTSVKVTEAGLGFKQGQIYTINSTGGIGTKLLISNVTSTGAINDVQILSFGHSYTNNFDVQLSSDKALNDDSFQRELSIVNDTTKGFLSSGSIKHTANGQLLSTFGNNTSVTISSTSNIFGSDNTKALLSFTIGGLASFPGEFTTNKGFLSDPDIRLQNDLLYQPFAYQLVTGVDINTFKDVVLDTIHPAGQRLFNNREFSDILDVRANVTTQSFDNLIINLFDTFDVDDANVGRTQGTSIVDVTSGTVDNGNVLVTTQTYFAEAYCVDQDPTDADSYIGFTTEFF